MPRAETTPAARPSLAPRAATYNMSGPGVTLRVSPASTNRSRACRSGTREFYRHRRSAPGRLYAPAVLLGHGDRGEGDLPARRPLLQRQADGRRRRVVEGSGQHLDGIFGDPLGPLPAETLAGHGDEPLAGHPLDGQQAVPGPLHLDVDRLALEQQPGEWRDTGVTIDDGRIRRGPTAADEPRPVLQRHG